MTIVVEKANLKDCLSKELLKKNLNDAKGRCNMEEKVVIPFKREELDGETYRAKVYNGWLIQSYQCYDNGSTLAFISDINHVWEVE